MKKAILLITAAIFSVTLCMDQEKKEKKQMTIEQKTEKMVNFLQLNDKQAKELKQLNEKYADLLQRPARPHGKGHFGGPRGQRPPKMKQDGDENLEKRPDMKSGHHGKPNHPQISDEERAKMTELLNSGFIDTYRYKYPDTIDKDSDTGAPDVESSTASETESSSLLQEQDIV